jgi:hypothetical protein
MPLSSARFRRVGTLVVDRGEARSGVSPWSFSGLVLPLSETVLYPHGQFKIPRRFQVRTQSTDR